MIYRKNTGVSKKKKKTLAKGKALITDALCVTDTLQKKKKKVITHGKESKSLRLARHISSNTKSSF